MPNITTNHAITYTNCSFEQRRFPTNVRIRAYLLITVLKMCASLGEKSVIDRELVHSGSFTFLCRCLNYSKPCMSTEIEPADNAGEFPTQHSFFINHE